jgi:TPP-dependent pyruvate/acetoin dehydrogenase alpha subunit
MFQKKCIKQSIISEKEFLKIEDKVKQMIEDEVDSVEQLSNPSADSTSSSITCLTLSSIFKNSFSEIIDCLIHFF